MKKKYMIMFVLMFMVSCSFTKNWYINEYGYYVPKNPKYQLKDKQGVFPENLDTTNIYKTVKIFEDGELIYPIDDIKKEVGNLEVFQTNRLFMYQKFYSNGRILRFSISKYKKNNSNNELNEKDLNPSNSNSSIGYYYSPDGHKILVEIFVYNGFLGKYIISQNNFINKTGDTIITYIANRKYINVKQEIPRSWKKYEVHW